MSCWLIPAATLRIDVPAEIGRASSCRTMENFHLWVGAVAAAAPARMIRCDQAAEHDRRNEHRRAATATMPEHGFIRCGAVCIRPFQR